MRDGRKAEALIGEAVAADTAALPGAVPRFGDRPSSVASPIHSSSTAPPKGARAGAPAPIGAALSISVQPAFISASIAARRGDWQIGATARGRPEIRKGAAPRKRSKALRRGACVLCVEKLMIFLENLVLPRRWGRGATCRRDS
jgi:hypothetical protein